MRHLRNAAIVLLLAAVVAFAPAGSNAADVVLTLITMAFLTAIAWTAYVLSRGERPLAAAGAAAVAVLALAGTAASVVLGIVVMTSK